MYEFTIRINSSKVTGTNTNFPVLITDASGNIPDAFFSYVVDSLGKDIRFYASDGVTELKREIAYFNAGTKKIEAWVQIASLTSTNDVFIVCRCGGSTKVNDTGVWSDVHNEAVYHFNDLTDSSGNGCDASIAAGSPTSTSGKVGKAYLFNDSNGDYLQVGTHSNLNLTTVGSLSAWVKGTQAGHHSVIFGKGNYGTNVNGYVFDAIGDLNLFLADASSYDYLSGANNIGDGNWHHVVGTWDSSTMRLFIDGSPRETLTETRIPVSNVYDLLIGKAPGYSQTYRGYLDEARINSTVLSANWIATEYANQNSPSTFYNTFTGVYKFKITIDKNKVTGTNTNFVYLFSELCSSIPAGFWAHVKDSTGLDIRFFDTDGVAELKREVVLYSADNSKVEAWVQIPSLGTATNKEIWCQYGGPTVANSTAVWSDVNASGIYHGQNVFNDSTGSANGVVSGMTQVDGGKINKGYQSTGGANKITITKQMHSGVYTICAWVYMTGNNSSDRVIASDFIGGNTSYALILRNNTSFYGPNQSNGTIGWAIYQYQGTLGWAGAISGDTYNSQINAWHRVVGTYNGSHIFKIYVDGILKNTYNITPYNLTTANSTNTIGTLSGYGLSLIGTVDELNYYTDAKSSDWIATEYANQNAPDTFSSCGAESSVQTSKESIIIMWMSGV